MKQVIVLRKDLNMRKGKMIAQGAHACLQVSLNSQNTKEFKQWLEQGMTKVCLYVESEQELLDIYNRAKCDKLPCSIIRDAGKTEFDGIPTLTTVAIGPAESTKIDKITGDLKLL
jgi:PTH2 family peptidyl-tRNA hydrolase